VLRLINFAHGDIFMVGAYIAYFVAVLLLGGGMSGLGVSPGVALAITVPAPRS
jgi:branched-chain amino acid transport system permease protein